ncbi:(Fe-S)-binding protein [Helicobacter cappadocius]|uniref:Glycolate oxidase iron-sulfur subunit n=1 Tax=Helicobacter cappadocius TaxID=3063998 RepID=A0AA90PJA8_9HELI|nr:MULTISPECIES: (Fe-S)-binding protein [unclassified Helicobacter]MDO7252372.1 (Fe-S)-binding protein [Helicobacter sp. faydin-H75]MDP2538239.1 (Fe-S)-binding protein [Helicobacter sp. faydin-H76]
MSIDFKSISNACVKCGKCIPSCTIYQINRDESTSPRGFLDLLGAYERGDLELDKNAKNIFESCFLCTTCVQICPNTLPVDVMIEKIRVDIAKKYGISWSKKIFFYLLRHRKMMDFVFSFVYFAAPCIFKKNPSNTKNTLRFSLPKVRKRTIFPFSSKSFLQKHKGEIVSKNTSKNRELTHNKVAIFIGCLSNYNYVNVGESLLFILDKIGVDTLIPKQECCGAPAYFSGDIATVKYLVKKNITYFEEFIDKIDAILIPEATCAAMLIEDWKHILEDEEPQWIQRLNKLTPKMKMASFWLENSTILPDILQKIPFQEKNLTYHDPCHARKVLKIYKEPRNLLSKNYSLVEMSDSSRCCGFGGISMQSEKYDLTLKAGIPKAQMIKESKAQIVSAECSACRMQLDNAMDNLGVNATFSHPLELIAQALGK